MSARGRRRRRVASSGTSRSAGGDGLDASGASQQAEGNGFEAFTEWQAHQYNEGYYVGGRLRPFRLYPDRPLDNYQWGLLLLAAGVLAAILVLSAVLGWLAPLPQKLPAALGFIGLVAAVLLVRAWWVRGRDQDGR